MFLLYMYSSHLGHITGERPPMLEEMNYAYSLKISEAYPGVDPACQFDQSTIRLLKDPNVLMFMQNTDG